MGEQKVRRARVLAKTSLPVPAKFQHLSTPANRIRHLLVFHWQHLTGGDLPVKLIRLCIILTSSF